VRVPPAAGVPLEPCPEDMGARRGAAEPFACTCTAQAADTGTAFGTDVYAGASSVCRSALHAGVIGPGGGAVTVIPEPGRATYPGVTRNGVPSVNFGAWEASFRVEPGPGQARRATTAAVAPCPNDFMTYRGTVEPLPCACSRAATSPLDSVFGTDAYTDSSSVCRAALHAGVVGPAAPSP
jgi:hypothetical protein